MEVHQVYEPTAVMYSYGLAVLGSLAAVVVMDYRRQVSKRWLQRSLLLASATALGGCGIWAMHFMGMTALKLKDPHGRAYPMSYDLRTTVLSLGAAVVFVYLGLEVATLDDYFGKDTEQRVAALQQSISKKDLKSVKKGGKALVEFQALYAKLHWLIAGGVLAAAGVCIMHYEGMHAMRMNLQRDWRLDIVIASAVIAVTAASAAFWILFRVLEWKPHLNYLRLAAALIMGVAVCGMHYTGMYAAVYQTLPDSATQQVIIPNGHIIAKWAVASEVVYCVSVIFFCYTKSRTSERTLKREVDKLYKSLGAACSEVGDILSTTGSVSGINRSPSARGGASSVGGARHNGLEKEKALQFVALALRFCLAHNSKKNDYDVEAVEQSIMEALRGTDTRPAFSTHTNTNRLGGPSSGSMGTLQKGKSKARNLGGDERATDVALSSTFNQSLNENNFTRASDVVVTRLSDNKGPPPATEEPLLRVSDASTVRFSDVASSSARPSLEPPSPVAPEAPHLAPLKSTRTLLSTSQTVTVRPKGASDRGLGESSKSFSASSSKLSTTGSIARGADMV